VRAKLVPFALLSGAAVVNLPVVHSLAQPGLDFGARLVALFLGGLAMGLAWAAGASLEDRRRGSVAAVCALGVLSPLMAAAPVARALVGPTLPWLVACAALALAGLVALRLRWRS
jgi:hypothetical protein